MDENISEYITVKLIDLVNSSVVTQSFLNFPTSIMHDEYGKIDSSGETFVCRDFVLESGVILPEAQVRYNLYGTMNTEKNNIMIVCHALTGNSKLDQWWGSMLGPGKTFDTSKYLVVCANAMGSCYGSTGPMSTNPLTGELYGMTFPEVTIRDTVSLHMKMVKEALLAERIFCVIGGSMGGMHALEWGIMGGEYVQSIVVIACNAAHSAWQIAMSETQRQAIYADPKWNNGNIDYNDPPNSGLAVARQIGMVSYRTAKGYNAKFGREKDETGVWQVKRYLEYQGKKILDRFDAITYIKLTEQLDTHDVARGRGGDDETGSGTSGSGSGSIDRALSLIRGRTLVMGIESDMLYPLCEQQDLAARMPGCTFRVVTSQEGHDGFILEQEQLG
eukprot:gene9156-18971_t